MPLGGITGRGFYLGGKSWIEYAAPKKQDTSFSSAKSWFTSLQVDLRDFSSKEQSLVAYDGQGTEEVSLVVDADNGMTVNFKTLSQNETIVIGDAWNGSARNPAWNHGAWRAM